MSESQWWCCCLGHWAHEGHRQVPRPGAEVALPMPLSWIAGGQTRLPEWGGTEVTAAQAKAVPRAGLELQDVSRAPKGSSLTRTGAAARPAGRCLRSGSGSGVEVKFGGWGED